MVPEVGLEPLLISIHAPHEGERPANLTMCF